MEGFWTYVIFPFAGYDITVRMVFVAALVVLATKGIATGLTRFLLRPFFRRNNVDLGRSYAVTRIIRIVIYTTGFFVGLSLLEIEVGALWAAGAALLVGVGIGLQQTFNDFFCGLILLLEGPVEVGNVIEVDGFIGRVSEIGLRTSKIRTRDDISIIVPNSHLITDNIINWSHNRRPLRFHIDIGVAYGSDVALVTELLERAAEEHESILERPASQVMFKGFGASSLDFELYFYSQQPWSIEFVKSDLRYRITALFVEHEVTIPFPQQDLWLRNPQVLAQAFQAEGGLRQNGARRPSEAPEASPEPRPRGGGNDPAPESVTPDDGRIRRRSIFR